MPDFPDFVGPALGAITAIGRGIFGSKQLRLANQINPVYNPYQVSPYAKNKLSLAQQMFYGRSPAAASAENNILANESQTVDNLAKGATDSSQFLSGAATAGGQAAGSFNTLYNQEATSKYGMLNNLNSAYDSMTEEGDKVYQDQLRKYQMDVAEKNALTSAGAGNVYGAGGDLSSFGMMLPQIFGRK